MIADVDMSEPTRPLPPMIPTPDGGWRTTTVLTPVSFTTRGLALMPPSSTIPVIVVPGIMGTNLRAKAQPRSADETSREVGPGQAVWRPPNTLPGGLWDAFAWDNHTPKQRQRLFDADTIEVDAGGPAHIPHGDGRLHIHPGLARERGWGEVHADSYIGLLCALQTRLNQTFRHDDPDGDRQVLPHWQAVMACDPARWGMPRMKPLTEADLDKHARHHYPVYAVGYNWLECCAKAAQRLERRVDEIIEAWRGMKRQCDRVILVTHSMGGLVARACAKRIPDRIAGVIHGVMPALGAPAAYRRMACGTEAQDFVGKFTAMILGKTTYDTTPVLATSPGALELLPTHLYPGPWLHVGVAQPSGRGDGREAVVDYLHLPNEEQPNPYAMYQDMQPWFRLVDPGLADPAGKFAQRKGGVEKAIKDAIGIAEQFHRNCLGDYYHPNTYAFYGADPNQLAFGHVRWVGRKESGSRTVLTTANISKAKFERNADAGGRCVDIEPGCMICFQPEPPATSGDRTVPYQSGAGPAGKVEHLFETRGYDHQGSYNNDDMLMLTLRLVVRIVQGIP
jgi:pimeloyl-ACP methyl ester carboxylesterase